MPAASVFVFLLVTACLYIWVKWDMGKSVEKMGVVFVWFLAMAIDLVCRIWLNGLVTADKSISNHLLWPIWLALALPLVS